MSKLRTRNVFLDAEVFRVGGFNYRSTVFKTLQSLVASGKVCVFVTDLTVKEVQELIRREVAEATRAQKAFEQKAYILRNSKSKRLSARLKPFDTHLVEKDTLKQFAQFLRQTKTTVLRTNRVDIADVFDRYFTTKPPFGPNKKRNEFPDAFAAAAVRDWCTKQKAQMYIVSGDSDMQSVCSDGRLHSLKRLADFLDLIASDDAKLVAFIREQIAKCEDQVIQDIKQQFASGGFVLEDQDGDVDDVEVVEVVLGEIDVIQAGEKDATLEAEAEVTFNAELSYGDEGTASYDSEDKTVFYHDHVRETVQRTEYIAVEINVFYEDRDPDSFEISDVSIPSETIQVESSQNEGWPWK